MSSSLALYSVHNFFCKTVSEMEKNSGCNKSVITACMHMLRCLRQKKGGPVSAPWATSTQCDA